MKFTKKELTGIIKICDAINDMPLIFRSNVSLSALKANMENWVKGNSIKYWPSLKSNLAGIEADRKEWQRFYENGTFKDNPNLKKECSKLAMEYAKILIQYPNDYDWTKKHIKEITEIKIVVSHLDNDLFQKRIFD